MKPGWLGYLGRLAGVLVGNALLAYGVAAVYLPAGLAVGGATGVGLILHTLFGLDTAVSVFVLNLGPVSYTHLDVYKRQLLHSVTTSEISH